MRGSFFVLAMIFLLGGMFFFATGCTTGARLAFNYAADQALKPDSEKADKYSLETYNPSIDKVGGGFHRIEQSEPYWYVVYNHDKIEGAEERWREYIEESILGGNEDEFEYDVVRMDEISVGRGKVARQVEGIIEISKVSQN
ncbi:MAG: hypothetical protein ACOCVY_02680 [Patescibacteria group bacterium]